MLHKRINICISVSWWMLCAGQVHSRLPTWIFGGLFRNTIYAVMLGLNNAAIVYCIYIGTGFNESLQLIVLLVLFVSQLSLCLSRKLLWNTISVLACYTFILNCIYVFGSIRQMDFNKWAYSYAKQSDGNLLLNIYDDNTIVAYKAAALPHKTLFHGDVSQVLASIPSTLWTYLGTEMLNLMCDEVLYAVPTRVIPFNQISSMSVLCIFNVLIPFAAVSQSPGTDYLANDASPLLPGLGAIFGIQPHLATFLQILALFQLSLCACFSLSKLLVSMSDSKLLPDFLSRRSNNDRVPFYSVCCGALFALISVVIVLSRISNFSVWANILAIAAFVTFLVQLIGYCSLKIKASRFKREFRSPFGLVGAIFAFVVFLFGLVCTVCYLPSGMVALLIVTSYVIAVSVYYFTCGMKRQIFSEDEKDLLLPLYVEIRISNDYLHSKYWLLRSLMLVIYPPRQQISSLGRPSALRRIQKKQKASERVPYLERIMKYKDVLKKRVAPDPSSTRDGNRDVNRGMIRVLSSNGPPIGVPAATGVPFRSEDFDFEPNFKWSGASWSDTGCGVVGNANGVLSSNVVGPGTPCWDNVGRHASKGVVQEGSSPTRRPAVANSVLTSINGIGSISHAAAINPVELDLSTPNYNFDAFDLVKLRPTILEVPMSSLYNNGYTSIDNSTCNGSRRRAFDIGTSEATAEGTSGYVSGERRHYAGSRKAKVESGEMAALCVHGRVEEEQLYEDIK